MEDNKPTITKDAEAEMIKIVDAAELKVHQTIEEASKIVNGEATKTFSEIEQKLLHIIREAIKMAEADAARIVAQAEDKAQLIIEEARQKAQEIEKAVLEAEVEGDKRKVAHNRRIELVIIPPVDFVQVEKLRLSLQQQANLRILSMWGTADGGASIFALTEKEASVISDLRKIDVVEEAIEIDEELLGFDLISQFVKYNLPLRFSKRDGEQRVLLLLKKTQ